MNILIGHPIFICEIQFKEKLLRLALGQLQAFIVRIELDFLQIRQKDLHVPLQFLEDELFLLFLSQKR